MRAKLAPLFACVRVDDMSPPFQGVFFTHLLKLFWGGRKRGRERERVRVKDRYIVREIDREVERESERERGFIYRERQRKGER